jgi:hypothetical protein
MILSFEDLIPLFQCVVWDCGMIAFLGVERDLM